MEDPRELSKRRFGPAAERYVTSADHAHGESLDRLIQLVDPRPEWRALDIATGGGHTALALAPRVREVVASDLTREMLDAAERFIRGKGVANVTFREADATALPFGDGEFDLVVCRVAPHHFPDCARFTHEMARVLKPGGVAAMIDNVVPEDAATADFINAFEKKRDPSHVRAHSRSRWIRFFTDAEFTVRAVEIFRKVRDLDFWMGMQSVDDTTKAELRVMLRNAPPSVFWELAPEESGGKLRFYLTEVLLVADLPPSSRP